MAEILTPYCLVAQEIKLCSGELKTLKIKRVIAILAFLSKWLITPKLLHVGYLHRYVIHELFP